MSSKQKGDKNKQDKTVVTAKPSIKSKDDTKANVKGTTTKEIKTEAKKQTRQEEELKKKKYQSEKEEDDEKDEDDKVCKIWLFIC